MATYAYPQPAAANYYAPSVHTQKDRGYRICDNCSAHERPPVKFRLCGGCMTTQYCSQECQRAHWSSHKPICQHTVAQLTAASQGAYQDENIAKSLRKFTSMHSALLGWAGFQALRLKRVPANVRQQALLVELSYNPRADSRRQFSIAGSRVVSRTFIHDPLVIDDIQRREARCRQSGGIGTCVVIIQCGSISQVMPVEVDPPSKITWDSREDWADVLSDFVESGRTDFKPISTTSRGIRYG